MTLILTPQELRDLLDGRAVALVAADTDPDPLRDPTLKPPPWEPDATTPSLPSPSSTRLDDVNGGPVRQGQPGKQTAPWPVRIRHDPPVDMTPRVTCAPRGED